MGGICCTSGDEHQMRAGQIGAMLKRSSYRGQAQSIDLPRIALGLQHHRGEAGLYQDQDYVCVLHGFINGHGQVPTDGNLSSAQRLAQTWQSHGTVGLTNLGGQFAFILYERQTQRVVFGRSIDATRPLFYQNDSTGIRLASEVRQLHAARAESASLDEAGFVQALCFYGTPDPERTAYQGVHRCPGGKVLTYQLGAERPQPLASLWDPPAKETHLSPSDWVGEFRRVFRSATEDCLPAWDSALLLSGGLDSATIWRQAQDFASAPCKALSLVYPGWKNDEQHYIEDIHRHCSTSGMLLDGRHRLPGANLQAEVEASDHWLWSGSTFQIDQLLQASKDQEAGSIVTGFGADEWLLSYRGYIADLFWQGHFIQAFRLGLNYQGDSGNSPYSRANLRRFLHLITANRVPGLRDGLRPASPPTWLSDRWAEAWQDWHGDSQARPGRPLAEQQLEQLLRIRRAGVTSEPFEQRVAQYGMDDRHPYLDRRVIELAFRIPPQMLDRQIWKSLQRETFATALPTSVVKRRTATLQDDCRHRAPSVLSSLGEVETWHLAQRGICSPSSLRRWLENQPSIYLSPDVEFLASAELFLRGRFT